MPSKRRQKNERFLAYLSEYSLAGCSGRPGDCLYHLPDFFIDQRDQGRPNLDRLGGYLRGFFNCPEDGTAYPALGFE
jgi:hypothetical protein